MEASFQAALIRQMCMLASVVLPRPTELIATLRRKVRKRAAVRSRRRGVGLVERNITQRLSQGQETVMGECGTELSERQGQRIDNARAFLEPVASFGGLCLRNLLRPERRRSRVNAWRPRTIPDRSVRGPLPDACIRNGNRN